MRLVTLGAGPRLRHLDICDRIEALGGCCSDSQDSAQHYGASRRAGFCPAVWLLEIFPVVRSFQVGVALLEFDRGAHRTPAALARSPCRNRELALDREKS